MLSPTPRGLAAAAAGLVPALLVAAGVPGAVPLWLALAALLAAAAAWDAAATPRRSRLGLAVEVPPLLAVGHRGTATVRLFLPGARPRAAELLVEVSDHLAPPPAARLEIGPGWTEVPVELAARRRGEARVEEVWLRWQGPLGLVRRADRRRFDAVVPVTPDLAGVGRRAVEHLSSRDAQLGQRLERYAGQGTEFHALREWSTGLDRRDIDWKASARHTRLLSRELRAERNHQIVLALDTGRLMAEPLAGLSRLDHAVHAALLLASASLRYGDRVGVFAFDERPRAWAPPRAGRGTLAGLLHLAAGLDAGSAETNFTLGLTELARHLRRRSLVVVLTDFVDAVTADLMVDNLVRLAHRQLVLFVAFRDPLVAALIDAAPASRLDVERAVVAGSLDRERREVLARLGRQGVQVVDAAPAEVGPELLDRYLLIKRREMI